MTTDATEPTGAWSEPSLTEQLSRALAHAARLRQGRDIAIAAAEERYRQLAGEVAHTRDWCARLASRGVDPSASRVVVELDAALAATAPTDTPTPPPVAEPPPARVELGSEAQEPLNIRHGLAQILALATAKASSSNPDIVRREQAQALSLIAERAIRVSRAVDIPAADLTADLVRVTQERDEARRDLAAAIQTERRWAAQTDIRGTQ